MKFTANRLLLLKAVKAALRIVQPNTDIPEISGILIEADAPGGLLTVTGTDIRTHIQRRLRQEQVEESGSIILPPLIARVLDKLAGDTVSFQSDGGMVQIHSESAWYSLPFLTAKAFPKLQIPFPEDMIRVQGLKNLLQKTVFAADTQTTDPNKASLQYVRLCLADSTTTAEATNGLCAAIATASHCADGKLELFLHKKAVQVLSAVMDSSDEFFVGITDKYAVLLKEDLFISSMMFAGNYLAGSRVLERFDPVYRATTDAEMLGELCENVSTLFSEEDDACINLCIGADAVSMRAQTASGHSSSATAAADTTPTPETGFHFNCRLLLDCLRHTSGPLRLLLDKRGLLVLEANQNRYFVCPRGPVRIAEKKSIPDEKTKKPKTKSKTRASAKAA